MFAFAVGKQLQHSDTAKNSWPPPRWKARSYRAKRDKVTDERASCGQKNEENGSLSLRTKRLFFEFFEFALAQFALAQQAGVRRVYLHGCVECNKKVWGPNDLSTVCELCGAQRFDAGGKPKEFIVHFPLFDQFKSLLTCKQYQRAVRWESLRPKGNPNYMCGKVIY